MRRSIVLLFLFFLAGNITLFSQEKMYIHKSDQTTIEQLISETDSVYFNNDNTIITFKIGNYVTQYNVTEIDSISFGEVSNTVNITYDGMSVSVINPLAASGVSVSVIAADVIVTSTVQDIEVNYVLSGTTPEGMFKIYSTYKYNLILNSVNIANSDGPAINIQSDKKCSVILNSGNTSYLTDGPSYTSSSEDQKATLFSEGQIEFGGTGNLNVVSMSKHAICSDDYIKVESGTITVQSAAKDGVHVNDYFKMSGGTLNITASGDGIESAGYVEVTGGSIYANNPADDVKGIACDSTMLISGGIISLTVSGNQSKGLRSAQNMELNGGTININTSGGVVLEASGSGYNPAYCAAIKCDSIITINGANVTIVSTGAGGKGITSKNNINITSGSVNIKTSGAGAKYTNSSGVADSYSTSCISSDVNVCIINGIVTTSNSGSGGKGISAEGTITFGDVNNSPTVNITTTGSKFVVSGTDYCHPKAIRATGAITINNGTTVISSTDDGMHSDASITIAGGTVTIKNSTEGIESKYIYLNGGNTNVTASNDAINATMGTVSGGTESNDNSYLYVNGGTHSINCTNGDAVDSNGNIVMTGGTVIANGPLSGVEEAVDFNGAFNMNGGFFIGSGSSSNMTKAMSTTSTQPNFYISSSSVISSSTLFHIQDASGVDIITFKPVYGGYKFLFSCTALTKGASYSIYTGGSYTGGTSTNGLYTGGTYSTTGATLKTTKTLSTSGAVNTISF
jgi:hypothetical protein